MVELEGHKGLLTREEGNYQNDKKDQNKQADNFLYIFLKEFCHGF